MDANQALHTALVAIGVALLLPAYGRFRKWLQYWFYLGAGGLLYSLGWLAGAAAHYLWPDKPA
jgi:zinc transporter ZupT